MSVKSMQFFSLWTFVHQTAFSPFAWPHNKILAFNVMELG